MNKLMGFFELKKSSLPCVKWSSFDPSMVLRRSLLWTVRTAVLQGEDLNLPRKIGVPADEAYAFAVEQFNRLGDTGMVVVYPYFIADKSGTLEVGQNTVTIEAVEADLWNLVTENRKDITIHESSNSSFVDGNKDFFLREELDEIKSNISKVRGVFRDALSSGHTVLLEWSFAYDTDINKRAVGKKYLLFYEARTL